MIVIKRLCGCLIVGAALAAGACVQVQAPTDTGDVATATSSTSNGTVNPPPTSTSTGPFSYNQDVKAILDSDCPSFVTARVVLMLATASRHTRKPCGP